MKKISICMATYEMGGYGHVLLDTLLTSLKSQTLQDFDVVISDQSNDTKVLEVCEKHSVSIDIKYFKYFYNRGKAACNINEAMKYATGEVIKILYQDDYFTEVEALSKIYKKFQEGAKWVINGWTHTQDDSSYFNTKIPFYGDHIIVGENSLGNPSNFAILSSERIFMDESLLYVVDCEFYYQAKLKLGPPDIITDPLVCARIHPVSSFNNPKFMNLKEEEVNYCLKKHNIRLI